MVKEASQALEDMKDLIWVRALSWRRPALFSSRLCAALLSQVPIPAFFFVLGYFAFWISVTVYCYSVKSHKTLL